MSRLKIAGIFVCLYAFAIFFFAYVYSQMPHAFYESNIKYELAYAEKTKTLTNEIIYDLYRGPCQPAAAQNDPFCLDAKAYDVDLGDGKTASISNFSYAATLSVADGAIVVPVWDNATFSDGSRSSINLSVKISNDGHNPERPIEILSDVFTSDKFLNTSGFNAEFLFPDPNEAPLLNDSQWRALTRFIVESQFRAKVRTQSSNSIAAYIAVPGNVGQVDALVGQMNAFLQASSGYTSDLDDNFGRMTYFSAVTITTVGFGDIVPITSAARRWVAIEAILGIVLIGVFINLVVGAADRTA